MTDQKTGLISKYKSIVSSGNESELYKWELVEKFKGKPDTNADNFADEFSQVNYGNLIYQLANAVRLHLLKVKPEEYRQIIALLFDEAVPLKERIVSFQAQVSELYKSLGETLQHHHDERTISAFLAFKYPEKYPVYKNSIYSAYCKKLGLKPASKNEKYLHYLELIRDLVSNYIEKDTELLNLKENFLTEDCYPDPANLLLAQDILYQTLTENAEPQPTTDEFPIPKNINKTMEQPLNQILFGPPGTGKTYNTINKAIQIINPDFNLDQDRSIIKKEYDHLIEEGQIVFTTFHQSMSYEDFVEGIKPSIEENESEEKNVVYDIVDGIFKRVAGQSKIIDKISRTDIDWDNVDYYKMSLGGKNNPHEHEYCIENNIGGITWGGLHDLSDIVSNKNWVQFRNAYREKYSEDAENSSFNITATYALARMKQGDIVIATKGNHIIDAIGKVTGDYFYDNENPTSLLHFRKIEWFAKNLNASPEKFFRKKISMQSIYQFYNEDVKKDAFKELTSTTENLPKNHILIIDEINRGNVSQIFGELITLIEKDKRLGNDEALEAILPYSKEKFGIPNNLYIIGTMNTADRSVEALDTALRRRFSFEEMPPIYDLEELQNTVFDIPLSEILRTINSRIEKLLDKDHCIGHAYFLGKNEDTLPDAFYRNIIPLLQEYFFGDFGKIGLVLGEGFIIKIENDSDFADFDHSDYADFAEKDSFEIVDYRNPETYHFVSKNGTEIPMDFQKAIQLLMKQNIA